MTLDSVMFRVLNVSLVAHDARNGKTRCLGRCGASAARRCETPLRQVTTHHRLEPISEHIRAKIAVKSFLEMRPHRISEKARAHACRLAVFGGFLAEITAFRAASCLRSGVNDRYSDISQLSIALVASIHELAHYVRACRRADITATAALYPAGDLR
jgi:hypothetical protein